MAKLCMGCMNPLPEGTTVCAICGFDPATDKNPDHCLPITASLQGHYIVGRLVAECSDHLLYLAYDRQMREPCFIQEFYPAGVGARDSIGGVQPIVGYEQEYQAYAEQFRSTMRTLARMRELPAVVPVYDIFEENGTVYAASDYCQGMTLAKKIKLSGGRIPWNEARPMFMALLSTLTHLNDAGIYHLAISPDNVIIGADGKPRLRNFSIAAAHCSGNDLTPALQSGYAAPEQYDGSMVSAPADVYGVAATLFRTVTGNEPPAGNCRAKNSDDLFMSAEVAEELTQPVCVALFNALQVNPDNRTATVAELRDQLSLEPTVSALAAEVEADMSRKDADGDKKKLRNILLIVGGCLLAVALLVVILIFTLGGNGGDEPDVEPTNPVPTFSTGTTEKNPDGSTSAVVDNLVGLNYYDLRDAKLNGEMVVVMDNMVYSSRPAGTILEQTPAASEKAEVGSEIKVVISLGREDDVIKVPDVRGWKEEHAKLYLEALGFRVSVVKLQDSSYAKGEVDSTDPKIGTEKRVGDTITLRVSDVETTTTSTTTSTTKATESTTQPTESTTQPTESTTQSTDPVSDPTSSETDPVQGEEPVSGE